MLQHQRLDAWNLLGVVQYRYSLLDLGFGIHPVVEMWTGYVPALKLYLRAMILEFIARGYPNFIPIPLIVNEIIAWPPWLGDDRLHSSHRANLLRKDLEYYSQFGWLDEPDNRYFWPDVTGADLRARTSSPIDFTG